MSSCARQRKKPAPPPISSCALDDTGAEIRNKSLDSQSVGVRRQALRDAASAGDDGDFRNRIYDRVGRARSGCGAAIVGDPDQVLASTTATATWALKRLFYPAIRKNERDLRPLCSARNQPHRLR